MKIQDAVALVTGANRGLAGLEAGRDEVLADELSRQVKQGLAAGPAIYTVPR